MEAYLLSKCEDFFENLELRPTSKIHPKPKNVSNISFLIIMHHLYKRR